MIKYYHDLVHLINPINPLNQLKLIKPIKCVISKKVISKPLKTEIIFSKDINKNNSTDNNPIEIKQTETNINDIKKDRKSVV